MPTNAPELRHRPADSEKITINLGYVDLGHVDLMVKDGFYSNRTDFIRTAIRNQLDRHADVVRQSVSRKALELGLRHYSRADLEAALTRGDLLHINVLGLASIAHDVTAELARASIASVTVLGALQASSEVKAALADNAQAAKEIGVRTEAAGHRQAGLLRLGFPGTGPNLPSRARPQKE